MNLSISGPGSLDVTSTSDGILAEGQVEIAGGTVNATSNGTGSVGGTGIWALTDVIIEDGIVTASGDERGIRGGDNVTITGGTVTATGGSAGICAQDLVDGKISIKGGTVTATGNKDFAMEGSVKNDFAGTGWTDAAGTKGEARIKIATSKEGHNLNDYLKVKFPSKTSIANAEVTLEQKSYPYDGKAKEPAVMSVKLNGETLKEGTDYTVSYKDNVNPGTATAIVTGAGDFAGTKSVSFTIEAAPDNPQQPTKEPVVNEPTVTTADIQAVEEVSGATTVVLGPKVKKIEAGAFAGTDVTTVIVKTKKLKKSAVKNAFKGSKVKTVKVKIKNLKSTKGLKGKALKNAKKYNKEAKAYNKKIAKKYKKFMTKKVVGKKVTVKA